MLSIDILNEKDIQKLKELPKSFLTTGIIYVAFFVPASFLFGLIGLADLSVGYWGVTTGLLIIFGLFTGWIIIKGYLLFKKDLSDLEKYTGVITVTGISVKKSGTTILTNVPDLPQIELLNSEINGSIQTGDRLIIEISKHSKTIQKLEKEKVNLLNHE